MRYSAASELLRVRRHQRVPHIDRLPARCAFWKLPTRPQALGVRVKMWDALMTAHPEHELAKRALYRIGAGLPAARLLRASRGEIRNLREALSGRAAGPVGAGQRHRVREGLQHDARRSADMDAYVGFYGARNPQDAASRVISEGRGL